MFSAIDIVLNGRDRSFDLIDEKRVNDSHIRLYLTDCGATCSFGLVLRKEFDTPFGLKIVKSLWKAPDTSGEDVKLQLPSDDEVDVLEQGTILARIRSNRGN